LVGKWARKMVSRSVMEMVVGMVVMMVVVMEYETVVVMGLNWGVTRVDS
jgi:hypothetical protein